MYDLDTLEQDADRLRRHDLFDADWYRRTYRDVRILGMDSAEHYLKYGAVMGRDPGPGFSTVFYESIYRDSLDQGINPLLHHMRTRETGGAPPPRHEYMLQALQTVSQLRGHAFAIELAERHLPPELRHTVGILIANQAIEARDETSWLSALNSYLEHFSLAALEVSQGEAPILNRLSAAQPPDAVADGPRVSVLMPAWNAEETLRYSANSILLQTWKNLELIIVDDASTDGTWDIIQELRAADPRVIALRNTVNAGPYVSKNVALTQARGAFITGHDADDWAHPQRIENQVRHLEQTDHPALLSGMLRMSAEGEFVRINAISGLVHDGATRGAFISMMARAQYFHDVLGFWDQVRVGGDSELIRRIEHLEGYAIPILQEPTMLCLDNPQGLTNDPVLGHHETSGVSPFRRQYKKAFTKAHAGLTKTNSRLEFPQRTRPFPAPDEICASSPGVRQLVDDYSKQIDLAERIQADVVIATDLRLPGGNASSTLDEVATFLDQGLSVSLLHCPTDVDIGKPLSDRYDCYRDIIHNWTRAQQIRSTVFICRHPKVATSVAFEKIAPLVDTQAAYIVKNNSSLSTDGTPVYDMRKMVSTARLIETSDLFFCPISPAMRAELQNFEKTSGISLNLIETDWTPTFNLALYRHEPKKTMTPPYRLGRHGRDSLEKWLEDPAKLRKAYPSSPDFRIIFLGGANKAKAIIGKFPKNWEIHNFGSIEPYEYLKMLDVFVYFPNNKLNEGFGRTIVEAMIAGVPIILPSRFSKIFDDLPLYLTPKNVQSAVELMARDDQGRQNYLKEVQNIATERYSSAVIARRLAGTGLATETGTQTHPPLTLSPAALSFRKKIMSGFSD